MREVVEAASKGQTVKMISQRTGSGKRARNTAVSRFTAEEPDNLELERWFRLPKGHERRIHGHRHAGVRIVQEGPTLVHALDAHLTHPEPFGVKDLLPYRSARPPECQRQAIHRRKIMRKARSQTKRPKLLAELERRYQVVSSRL